MLAVTYKRIRATLLLAVLALGGLIALPALAPVHARDTGADPTINLPYLDADWEQWVGRFERPGREVYDKRHEIVAALGLRPGMRVADVGAGTGLFTRLIAREVGPQGKVYAVDISRPFVENILRTAREQGLDNIEGIVNTQSDTLLPPESVDLIFVCDTYHHFEQPQAMLASIRRALRPGGTLVVVDFQRIPGVSSSWILRHVRLGKEEAVREIEAEGFRFVEERPFLRENYFVRFVKD